MSRGICLSRWLLMMNLGFICPVFTQFQSFSAPTISQSSAESAVRAVVEKYFTFYAAKDLDGLMSLWSRQSPDYVATRQALEKQFATEDAKFGRLTISRLKVEDKRASLRLAVELTVVGRQGKLSSYEARNLSLVCEADGWKLWQNALSLNELAAALDKAATRDERAKLLAEEKELVNVELVKALNHLGARKDTEGSYAQALKLAQISLEIAEDLGDLNGRAEALEIQGRVHMKQGRYEQA